VAHGQKSSLQAQSLQAIKPQSPSLIAVGVAESVAPLNRPDCADRLKEKKTMSNKVINTLTLFTFFIFVLKILKN
jgi:hypothetical protein